MTVSRIDSMICSQENLTELTRKKIQDIQLKKLNVLLAREKERAGFYSGLPEHLESLVELSDLPFTTEKNLKEHAPGMLLVSQSDIRRVITDRTSGTTGLSKRVFYTEGDCESTVQLFMAGLGELVYPGNVTMICMPFSGHFGLGELIAEAIERLGAKPLKIGVGKTYGQLKQILFSEYPDTYVGMPVPLFSMLRFCGRGTLRRALVSGDACPESVIHECGRILETELFPHYGSREMGLAGAICCQQHEGMHLRENHTIAEIIGEDGMPVPPGEFGELVITTIGAEAMPLIRYRTGDRTRILAGSCPCGSCTLRLDRLTRVETAEMERMDEMVFSLPGLVDWEVCKVGDTTKILALTDGTLTPEVIEAVLPHSTEISVRVVTDDDRPLYPGKRAVKHRSL